MLKLQQSSGTARCFHSIFHDRNSAELLVPHDGAIDLDKG